MACMQAGRDTPNAFQRLMQARLRSWHIALGIPAFSLAFSKESRMDRIRKEQGNENWS